ncbi:CDP-glycerol glycerophosphotransferase family protein [Clostridium sp. LIBA-8841]|uniref:CDP-glycerol glycerophosphotransferase family protein n=1 Tax=Clostridium sp. LIBA-8841 TaxID=2987530 RepID=UPI002AC6F0D6|nr:CDP-glycerol glycerophosphotransferase family protein [Clostridium sp. LIBA-8841]MDZ5254378.1 CDP-glycerol glycerophosphotransferase family protein [Clostridium sp. LIBA-8841]
MNEKKEKFSKAIVIAITKIFNCLPIKKNKIFFYSYYGSQYGCNPKYISEYIVKNYPGKFDLVWAFSSLKSKGNIPGVRKVKITSLRYIYELCTSKIIITNFRTTDTFIKRKDQYYIQTWHSSLRLKQIERDAEDTLPKDYVKMAKSDSKKIDLLLSGCKYSTDIFKRAFWYDGEIFEHGTPRNDIFFEKNTMANQEIKYKLNINKDKKIILYAPTFRKNNGLEVYNIDYSLIINSLKNKFNNDWFFLVKLHPHLVSKSRDLVFGEGVIDVTSYDDIQELLSVSDILISDYSSLMFDFALSEKPCFLYVPDLDEYTKADRKLYFDIKALPFISVKNNIELKAAIEDFDLYKYKKGLKDFSKEIGSFEEGKCCENLLKHIEEVCFK